MKLLCLLLCCIISSLFCATSKQSATYLLRKDTTFFYRWQTSTLRSIDSLLNASGNDSEYLNHLKESRYFFSNYSLSLRAMAVDSILRKTNERIFYDASTNLTCLLELYSAGYCNDYQFYILKKEGKDYFFEVECAKRTVKKSKRDEYSFKQMDKFKVEFNGKGDPINGITCMMTFIRNGEMKSYPLFYINKSMEGKFYGDLGLKDLF